MNTLDIWEPRWHDRVVLVADHKIGTDNQVVIHHKDYPEPLYMSGAWARQWPLEKLKTKRGGTMPVRAVPLDKLINKEEKTWPLNQL